MNSKPKIELLQIRNISGIFMDTLAFAKDNFKSLFSGLFYICSPALLVSGIGIFLFFNGYFTAIFKPMQNPQLGSSPYDESTINDILLLIPYSLLMFIGIYISMCFIISVSYSYIKLYRQDTEINTSSLWDTSKKYIWKIIGSQCLILLVILLAYVICLSPILLFFLGETAGILGILLTILFIFAFIFISFYFYVKFSFNQHFIVVEDQGIIESFKSSYRFSKGIFWKTFLSIFIISIIASICGSIFQTPGMIIAYAGMILGIVNPANDTSFIMLLGTAVMSIGMMISYLLHSVIYLGISFIYYSTVEERQGIKAKEIIGNIGKSEDLD